MTVRTLVLVRHGDASSFSLRDEQRRLSAAGRAQTNRLGALIAQEIAHFSCAVVSSAMRARQTFNEINASVSVKKGWVDKSLYYADVDEVLDIVRTMSGDAVLIVGHEPTISHTGRELACEEDAKELRGGVGTGTALVCRFDGEWEDIPSKGCRMSVIHVPVSYA